MRSIKIVLCSWGCNVKLIGVNRSYPTDPGVERCGVIVLVVSFWKSTFNLVGSGGPPGWGSPQVPLTQKNLPVPSCLDALRICAPSVGLGRRLSRFWSFAQDVSRVAEPLGYAL